MTWYIYYLRFVVLWGAVVRSTGSGAGCGRHWPLCPGILLPEKHFETFIEAFHRLTSALTVPLWLWVFWSLRKKNQNSWKFWWWTVLGLLLLEGALGAFLVKWEHVAYNTNMARAWSMGLHLISTFALTGSATTMFWIYNQKSHLTLLKPSFKYILGILFLLSTALFGALTALGDLLFPIVPGGAHAWELDQFPEHFLVSFRIFHPLWALMSSAYIAWVAWSQKDGSTKSLFMALGGTLLLGFLNIVFYVPLWTQILHLLFGQILWSEWILFVLEKFHKKQSSCHV